MKLVESKATRRILIFDIENRPLTYWFGDVTTSEITSIAWKWVGEDDVYVESLTTEPGSAESMLETFLEAYRQSDMVCGHYIRRHDLPIVQAALMEYGLPLLTAINSCDTKLDLVKRSGQPATLENIAALLGVEAPKVSMSQMDWREANRLTPEGIAKTENRVIGDIYLQEAVREALILRGWLKPPSMWYPVAGGFIYQAD
jgi:hypothetical protein